MKYRQRPAIWKRCPLPSLLPKESKGGSGFPDRRKSLLCAQLPRIRKSGKRPIRKPFRIRANPLPSCTLRRFLVVSRFALSGSVSGFPGASVTPRRREGVVP